MSKASEWMETAKARPEFYDAGGTTQVALRARVNDNGTFYVYIGGSTSPKEITLPSEKAVALARWILATFDGPEPSR